MRRVLTGMDIGVLLHIRFLVETLPAVLARVRPRVGVDQQVRRQRAAPLESLPALRARELLLLRVHRHVLL